MSSVVMVAEDEFFVALGIQEVVEGMGHVMTGPYASVAEAKLALASQKPDCAILDVCLKDGEVYPLADELEALRVPIVFHSGHANDTLLRERYPSAVICPKPSAPNALAAAITRAMNTRPQSQG